MSDNPTPAPLDDAPINFGRLRLAKHIHLSRGRGRGEFAVRIDGHEFPFYLDQDAAAHVSVGTGQLSAVTLTIIAETVTVDDRLLAPAPFYDDEG